MDDARMFQVENRMSDGGTKTPVRSDLIARVRQEILAGTYDTPERFDLALDRLADCLASD